MEQFTATGTYPDGTTQDLTALATWTSLNTAAATIGSGGLATSRSAGSTSITATYGTSSASSALAVTPPTLLLATIYPQNIFLPPGITQQFRAVGTYTDGSTQDVTALVSWGSINAGATISANGLATPTSAGTTLITAAANGFTSSTALTVTPGGPPTQTASLAPSPNAAGWNNTNVTVSFTCTPGGAVIISCPGPQTVTSEGANQVVSGTVTDSLGNTSTTTVTVNLDKTPPALAVASPTDEAVFTDSALTTTGTVSDVLSGIASLTCNLVPVTLSGGTFSCNISLNPGVNLVVVSTVDVAGNTALTKMHVTLNVPFSSPNSLQITPAIVNMVAGDTQAFTVVDDLGRPRTDARWTVSDPNFATITTDPSPVFTASAVGQVTLTATVQGGSIQTQVNMFGSSLNPGTVRWAVQPWTGSIVTQNVQAVPTTGGPDLYSIETSPNQTGIGNFVTIRALKADGRQMWQQPLGLQGIGTFVVPDGFGGLVVQSAPYDSFNGVQLNAFLMDLDGQTGAPVWQQSFAGSGYLGNGSVPGSTDLSIRPNGDIVMAGTDPTLGYSAPETLMVINGQTGQRTAIPFHSYTLSGNCYTGQTEHVYVIPERVSSDGNGNAYMEYASIDQMTATCANNVETDVWTTTLRLVTISSDNSTSEQTIKSRMDAHEGPVNAIGPFFPLAGGPVIPDGQGGVLAAWGEPGSIAANYPLKVTDFSPNGTSAYELPSLSMHLDPIAGGIPFLQMVLGEDGIACADNGQSVTAFGTTSGAIIWSFPAGAPGYQESTIVEATLGGGCTIVNWAQGVIHIDAKGNFSAPSAYLDDASPFDMSSWVGLTNLGLADIFSPNGSNGIPNTVALTESPGPGGDPQDQHEPPFCQRKDSHCVIAPHNDITIPSSPYTSGAPLREVNYEIFSFDNGVLTKVNTAAHNQVKIAVLETNSINSLHETCTLQALAKGDCQSPNTIDGPGFYTDSYSASDKGPNSVTQQFFVDRGLVLVFWPQSTSLWYGAYSQTAAVDRVNIPQGALIQQVNPDLQHGAICAGGCSFTQANGTPLR